MANQILKKKNTFILINMGNVFEDIDVARPVYNVVFPDSEGANYR